MSEGGKPSNIEDKRKEKLKEENREVNAELRSEMELWQLHEINPSNIDIDAFLLDVKFHALIDFLIEEGIIMDEAYTLKFKKHLLTMLQNWRPVAIETMEELRKKMAVAKPKVFGPDGGPLQ